MQEHTFRIPAPDGHQTFAVQWLPDRAVPLRAVLQIAHGLAEHSLRYRAFAAFLTARGYAVYGSDHRGHGQSLGPGDVHGHFADQDGWNKTLEDLWQVNREIAERHPDVPRILLGHSMGSFFARHYVLRYPRTLSGLIVSATGIRYGALAKAMRALARLEVRRIGPRAPSKLMAALALGTFNLQFFPARTNVDWLSRDREMVDRYIADPCCGFLCSAQFWVDQFGGFVEIEAQEKSGGHIPHELTVLMLAGKRDPLSMGGLGIKQLAKRYRAIGVANIETRLYPGGRHEMLNEINRAEVYADIANWLGRHFSRNRAATGELARAGGQRSPQKTTSR